MTKINIEEGIYLKIKERIKDGEFESVESYIHFILNQVVNKLEKNQNEDTKDEKEVRKRLKSLGYL